MKKIINNKNLIVCFLIAISLIFMLSSFLSIDKYLSILSLTTLFVTLVLDAFLDIKKKYLLLLFYATFFLFSMGQYYFPNNTNWIYYANYKINTIKLTIFIQWIALFFTFLSFNIFNKSIKIKELKIDYKKEINSKILMICLIFLFLITITSHLEIGYRVMKYGYLVIQQILCKHMISHSHGTNHLSLFDKPFYFFFR